MAMRRPLPVRGRDGGGRAVRGRARGRTGAPIRIEPEEDDQRVQEVGGQHESGDAHVGNAHGGNAGDGDDQNKQWDGTISSQEFKLAAFYLMKVWEACCDVNIPLWRWENSVGISPDSVGGYLVLEELAVASKRKVDDMYHVKCDVELEDAATIGEVANDCQYHLYTYHVLYSESYKVPLLFFSGYSPDGRRLDWEDIESDLPDSSRYVIDKSKWTFLSQEDHPYLHKPWFLLHPCGTSELMKLILWTWLLDSSASSNEGEGRRFCVMEMNIDYGHDAKEEIMQRYLLTWLSVSGPPVGLGLDSKELKRMWCYKQIDKI